MPFNATDFVDVKQLEITGVTAAGGATRLVIISGVALFGTEGFEEDWTRDDLVFSVKELPGVSASLERDFTDASVSVYPATFEEDAFSARPGWGVDAIGLTFWQ